MLHEIGHTMGLDDEYGSRRSTVMNQFSKALSPPPELGGWRDDPLFNIADFVSECDANNAVKASQHQ